MKNLIFLLTNGKKSSMDPTPRRCLKCNGTGRIMEYQDVLCDCRKYNNPNCSFCHRTGIVKKLVYVQCNHCYGRGYSK